MFQFVLKVYIRFCLIRSC